MQPTSEQLPAQERSIPSRRFGIFARSQLGMETGLKCLWFTATAIGTRRICKWAGSMAAYSDTAFAYPGVKGYVALTIDDGLCRMAGCSLTTQVGQLLNEHDARATFFVCSDYLAGCEQEAATLLAAGNEFANHLTADRSGHYHKLAPDALRAELREATDAIHALGQTSVKWFRAPQGRLTSSMRAVVVDEGMRHALGDAYCDDWCISDHTFVANTLLRQVCASPAASRLCMHACTRACACAQVQDGSIIIMHMPERGFRDHTLAAMAQLLAGLTERGLHVVTLSELDAMAASGTNANVEHLCSGGTPRVSPTVRACTHTAHTVPVLRARAVAE